MKSIVVHSPTRLTGDDNYALAVRGGDLAKEIIPGESITLTDTEGNKLADAEAVDIWAGPLGHTPALLVEMMHDPLCRTFAGLTAFLSIFQASGEPTPLTTPITILILKARKSEIIRPTRAEMKGLQS